MCLSMSLSRPAPKALGSTESRRAWLCTLLIYVVYNIISSGHNLFQGQTLFAIRKDERSPYFLRFRSHERCHIADVYPSKTLRVACRPLTLPYVWHALHNVACHHCRSTSAAGLTGFTKLPTIITSAPPTMAMSAKLNAGQCQPW